MPAPGEPVFLVVRGGIIRDVAVLRSRLEKAMAAGAGPVLSVFGERVRRYESHEQCIERICRSAGIPHPQIQVSSDDRLEHAGLSLVPDSSGGQADNHCHVVFKTPLNDAEVARYVEAFDPPVPNPTGGTKRKQS